MKFVSTTTGSAVVACLIAFCGCKPAAKTADAHPSPAKVDKVQQEGELNRIVLDAQAESSRLGITLAPVEMRPLRRVRSFGGEIALPPGASLVISAPVGGRIGLAGSGDVPSVGTRVTEKQPMLLLTPLLSPEREVLTPAERVSIAQTKSLLITARIDAEGQVATAKERVAAARISLERTQRLFRDAAGTAKAVDDAKGQLNVELAGLQAAESRLKAVENISLEGGEAGQQSPLVIESPQAGMIRTRHVAPGEVVTAGAPLFEVMKYDPVWVRVPVYAGETVQLALQEPAAVVPLNDREKSAGYAARPIAAPPTATPLASTVDLYYELPNPEGKLRPGERMTVKVKLQGASEQRVVPWSAVIHDINGGTWVYEKTAERTYVRRRVQVRYVVDELAVLESGPPVGANIVTAGAVELYGTEMGFAK